MGVLHGLRLLASLLLLLLALPFALVGWAWVCLRRMGPCALVGAFLGLSWNAVIVLEPLNGRHAVIGLLLGALVGLVVALVELIGPAFSGRAAPGTSHGSAAWASRRALRQGLAAPALARDPAALLVGRDPGRRGGLLRHAGPAHLLTIAPTRSGKGVGTVLPNLLLADRAILCVDPKGENARISARARRRFGPVFVLDPFGVSGQPASAFDPAGLLDAGSPDLADDATTLADALVFDPPGQVSDAHWNEEAKALISGLLLHLACRGAPGQRGLPALRRLLTLPPGDWQALLRAMLADTAAAGGLVSRAAARQLGKADREAAGVLSSAQRHTHLLDSPRLTASMSRTDFQWSDLRQGSATVFLVLPPDRLTTYSRWLRLLIAQGIQQLARTPQRPNTPPVLLLLDEFAALGRLEPVLQAAGLMAGLGLQLWPILQDLAQLRAAYGPSAATFLANAGLIQVSAPADLDTAQWLSRALGNSTVVFETGSTSRSIPDNPEGHGSSSHSSSTQLTGRPLLNPDEAMRLHPDRQVLLRPGQRPAFTAKLRHYEDKEFAGLADS
ncbi:type IV secretory system conjugative DNA transfer family protein [Roseomonas haemaphysalidis]|uniref:Type IV secretory system conjugative DNA transfer family protein n=1 Tax=Roseomonas haemaphysalidis TaxID=2768162 RepID=A0ABS3KVZ6_9PROT|nr:type IV secretory system conjugative DNA transfer family protein [Roseomonas haemaphysalidis]MBO1081652.1 type IV secretory system conjugative DNA transfer family protein [Roseomonas haemaphysalidis]